MLFDPIEVAELSTRIRTIPSAQGPRTTSAAALGVVGFALPDGTWTVLGVAGALGAAALIIGGAAGLIADHRADKALAAARAADRVPPAGMSWAEYVTVELADAPMHVDVYRGRVYRACRGEFWRSRFDGWCYARGARVVAVDDPAALAALEARDAREQISVVA